MLTYAILKHVQGLGYAVSVHHASGIVEMHAVKLAEPHDQYIARSVDANGGKQAYRAACALAEMVGINLEDG